MYENAQPIERVFLAFARNMNPALAHEALREDREVCELFQVDRAFELLNQIQNVEALEAACERANDDLKFFLTIWFVYLHGKSVGPDGIDRVKRVAGQTYNLSLLLNVFRLFLTSLTDYNESVANRLTESVARMSVLQGRDPFIDYVRIHSLNTAASIMVGTGNYREAKPLFEQAISLGERSGFMTVLAARRKFGDLLYHSGELETALGVHKHGDSRSWAASRELRSWSLASHDSAAKCALDLGQIEVAQEELLQARSLHDQFGAGTPSALAYLDLHTAELAMSLGDASQARSWLESAKTHFRRARVVEARSQITPELVALQFDWGDLPFDGRRKRVEEVIQVAERAGFAHGLDRALEFRSRLLNSEAADELLYEQVRRSAHLVVNPLIRMNVLGACFRYGVRQREREEDLAHVMARIKNLRPRMIESSYERAFGRLISSISDSGMAM